MKSGFGILTSEHFPRLDCWTMTAFLVWDASRIQAQMLAGSHLLLTDGCKL